MSEATFQRIAFDLAIAAQRLLATVHPADGKSDPATVSHEAIVGLQDALRRTEPESGGPPDMWSPAQWQVKVEEEVRTAAFEQVRSFRAEADQRDREAAAHDDDRAEEARLRGSAAAWRTAADNEVTLSFDPECIHAENIGEFHPEAIGRGTAVLEQMLTPGSRDHRDAGILAACVVSEALRALVAVEQADPDSALPITPKESGQ